MTGKTWSIAEVERETGLGKDTLRVWERRYGFPVPQRDRLGERAGRLRIGISWRGGIRQTRQAERSRPAQRAPRRWCAPATR